MADGIFGWILDKKVSPGQSLTQGDLIVFPAEENPLRKAGLVVTADCDLENRKHGLLVTLVPVVTVKEILERYLLIEACERQRKLIFNYVCDAFSIEFRDDEGIAAVELREKVEGEEEIDQVKKVAARFILNQLDILTWANYKALMVEIKANEKGASAIESQLKSKGDIMVLPSPRELGVDGDIAWVRHIWQIPLGSVAIRTSDVKNHPGERIARLDSPFRYRLTQIMAQVFSDIGLPNIVRDFKGDIEGVMKNG
ncbi:hypothetical protein KTD18_10200 [Burkholderia multivorans]|uniref:hypothetical protein n=1 Tax=Burkholderia multivorans TaxID=87883 RepID=UPI000AB36DD8|nr:hypothetical protein [Burkholderia multivorans]MBU9291921.1 hypothetical protein [Burkholderia multivorans]